MTGDLPGYIRGSADETLLKACLSEGPAAVAHWQAWRQAVDLDGIDVETQRLLPMLYATLQAAGVVDPALGRYRGVHRYQWYASQVAVPSIAAAVSALDQAGIATILLGQPVLSTFYPDPAHCPSKGSGILVPAGQLRAAVACLHKIGWTTPWHQTSIHRLRQAALVWGLELRDAGDRRLFLRWRVLADHPAERTESFWARALPFDIGGIATRRLDDADALIQIAQEAVRWHEPRSLARVADAWHVVRGRRIDWQRVTAEAHTQRLALPLRAMLRYLAEVFAAEIPPQVRDQLDRLPVGGQEMRDYRRFLKPPGERGAFPRLWRRSRYLTQYVIRPMLSRH